MIFLPNWLEKIVHALSFVLILIIELLYFLLTPFIWLKFKSHAVMFVLCAGLGCYWYFNGKEKSFLLAASIFLVFTLAIATIKWLRKRLKKIDECLLHYFHLYPLACVEIKIPITNKKYLEEKKHEKENENHHNNPYHYHRSDTMRGHFGNSDIPPRLVRESKLFNQYDSFRNHRNHRR